MKKSNKEVLDFLGLKVGDRVKILNCDFCDYFVIKKGKDGFEYAESVHSYRPCNTWYLQTLASILLEYEYEIVKPKKKLGDMKCEDFVRCKGCPFVLDNPAPNVCITSRTGNGNKTFIEIVESTQKELDDIKLRLDEEVEECEK